MPATADLKTCCKDTCAVVTGAAEVMSLKIRSSGHPCRSEAVGQDLSATGLKLCFKNP